MNFISHSLDTFIFYNIKIFYVHEEVVLQQNTTLFYSRLLMQYSPLPQEVTIGLAVDEPAFTNTIISHGN